MTVAQLRPDGDALDELVAKIDDFIASTIPSVTLAAARRMANDTGVARFAGEIDSLLAQRSDAVDEHLAAKHRLSVARDVHGESLADAEWALSDRFKTRGNKTYLVADEHGAPISEGDQQSFDAAARKAWTQRVAGASTEARDAAAAVTAAEETVANLAARLDHIDKALSAVKAQMSGAVAELETVRLALAARPTGAAR